jgi:hypothetical protein
MLQANATQHEIEIPRNAALNSQAGTDFPLKRIVQRARQIHREHGGLFGYDFDDWSQAWGERTDPTDETGIAITESQAISCALP